MHRNRVFLIGEGVDGHLVRYHECGIEAQTEMTDDLFLVGFVFVFFKKSLCAGKSDLIDVFIHFFESHTDTVVGDGSCLGIGI